MKRLLSIILCFILLLSACPFSVYSASLSSDRIVKTEDMESHEVNKTLELNTNEHFCGFGTQIGNTIITDEFSHTGSKSLKQYGRHSHGATVKIHNLFGKKLTKGDVGNRYNISFYVYADKESGVYKKSAAGTDKSQRKDYQYTEDELKESTGCKFTVYLAGPDAKRYKYRTGTVNAKYYLVPWNEWTLISYDYTVEEKYLPTDTTNEKSDPYLESIRVGQTGDYSINEGCSDTIYIDDITVTNVDGKEYVGMKYDDFESYSMNEQFVVKKHQSFCGFGTQTGKTVLSDKYSRSGSKSLCQTGRYGTGATVKALDLFGRDLTASDVGKAFRISFYVYFDKEAGVYKEDPSYVTADKRKELLYTEEELKNSKGTEMYVYMCGPDADRFAYRQGNNAAGCDFYFVPWNEWTEIVLYYTVKEEYLPTGGESDPYINAIRIGQGYADYSIDNALADTLYIDDLYVSEVGAFVDGGFVGDKVHAVTHYTDTCREDYARTYIFEYSDSGRLLGAKIGEKTATKDIAGKSVYTETVYDRKDSNSKIFTTVYADVFTKPLAHKSEMKPKPSGYEYATSEMAVRRAKEMLVLSKAEYEDEISFYDRVDNENEYFLAVADSSVSSSMPDTNYKSNTGLFASDSMSFALKFDISDSEKKSVSHAYLSLYTVSVTKGGKAEVYAVSSDWDEGTITYNKFPSLGEKIAELNIEYKDIVYYFDISSYINKTVKEGVNSLSFVIKTPDGNFKFISRETTERNYKPNLIFEGVGMSEGQKAVSSFDYSNYATAMKSRARGILDDSVYIPTPTKIVDSIKDYTPVENELTLNKYGSPVTEQKYNATGFFRTEKIDGRWWIIDPEGYKHIHTAIGVVQPARGNKVQAAAFDAKYGNKETWSKMVIDELRPFGFNGCGPWSEYKTLLEVKGDIPMNQAVFSIEFLEGYDPDDEDNVLPVFDPGFEIRCDGWAKGIVDKYADNPYIIGWMIENEPPANDNMLEATLNANPVEQKHIYSYYTAWEWLKSRYGENASINDVTDKDRFDWVEFVYDRYMKVCHDAIKKYAPNHMFLGPKLDKPHLASFRAMDDWVDIVCYDYYGNAWTAELPMIDRFYRASGRPMINAEWYCKGRDACTEETQLTNMSGVGYQAMTQKERGYYFQNFVLNMLESKVFVGWQWFRYTDNLADDRENTFADYNANKGVYTRDYKPWTELLGQMKMINRNIYGLCDYFDR